MKATRQELEDEIAELKEENQRLKDQIEKMKAKKAGKRLSKGVYQAPNGTVFIREED